MATDEKIKKLSTPEFYIAYNDRKREMMCIYISMS